MLPLRRDCLAEPAASAMRLLHVIHSLDPRSGGPSHAIRAMVREQVRAGCQVTLLATDVQSAEPWAPREEYRRHILEDPAFSGAEVFLGRSFGRRRPWSRFSYSPECAGWLCRRLADANKRPEVVHIHGVFSPGNGLWASSCASPAGRHPRRATREAIIRSDQP